ncbi:unnamed protein product, partial [Discosporangium mesarthrocarpum]
LTCWWGSSPSGSILRLARLGGMSCLVRREGYLTVGSEHPSGVCGPEQALRLVSTGAYFEAFRQDKVCLETAAGNILTLSKGRVGRACSPENQFVLQAVATVRMTRGRDALSFAPPPDQEPSGEYCVYNPISGFYLSSKARPQAQCGETEHWRLEQAPAVPSQKCAKGGRSSGGSSSSNAHRRASGKSGAPVSSSRRRHTSVAGAAVAALLDPHYASVRSPLVALYGYVAAATALLLARGLLKHMVERATRGGRGTDR